MAARQQSDHLGAEFWRSQPLGPPLRRDEISHVGIEEVAGFANEGAESATEAIAHRGPANGAADRVRHAGRRAGTGEWGEVHRDEGATESRTASQGREVTPATDSPDQAERFLRLRDRRRASTARP